MQATAMSSSKLPHFSACMIPRFVYCPWCHWLWGGGWLAQLGAVDFAGGATKKAASQHGPSLARHSCARDGGLFGPGEPLCPRHGGSPEKNPLCTVSLRCRPWAGKLGLILIPLGKREIRHNHQNRADLTLVRKEYCTRKTR